MENKLSQHICNSVLFIGPDYTPPKGGVAMVLENYDKFIFSSFKAIANSCEGSKLRKIKIALLAILKMCWMLLTDKQIKIVHIHTASGISFKRSTYFAKVARFFKKKVILHIHGGNFKRFYNSSPKNIKSELSKCDKIIALTNDWKDFFEEEVGLNNVMVIENVIPEPQLQQKSNNEKTHLLFLGLIHKDKGIYDLIEVINNHKHEFLNNLELHVGGNGEVRNLISTIEEYNLKDIVSYEGWVSGEKKIGLLNSADALILPSYIEGLPMVILEAMSYGLPVLSTPVGGIPEVVTAENGVLFNPGDKNDIHRAISQFISFDATKREQMRIEAMRKAEKFRPDSITNKLKMLYKELLNE